MENRYGHNKFLLKKKFFKLLGQDFRVFDPDGNLVLFSHQKAFKLKEDIRIYADEGKTQELIAIKARQIIDFSAAYDVVDSTNGQKVGALKRKGWSSLIRDTWILMDPSDAEIGQITEDSVLLATVRRWLSNLVPQSFTLKSQGRDLIDFHQHFNPFLFKMDIIFSPAADTLVDRRLGIAAAILMAAVEGRQSGG